MMNNEYKKWYLVLGIFSIVAMFFGGSLAYWQWTSNNEQKTSVALTVTEEFRCDVDGGGNISSEEKSLVPTDCMNSEYAIQRTIKVNPTLFSNNTNVSVDLWLNVNSIGTGLKNSENLMYSLTWSATSCTERIVTHGSFNGKGNGSKIELLNDKLYSSTFNDTYYLYIWLDKKETSQSTMNQTFNFSLGGECTGASKGEPFYAVYSADDTSLRFYKEDEGFIKEGEQYEGRTVTNVYKAYEGDSYNDAASVPWYNASINTTKIIIEDEIKPVSTAQWFRNFTKVSSVNVENLDTTNTVDMEYMFSQTGNSEIVTEFEIIGLDDLNVSNVENMNVLFQVTGYYATNFNIGDLSGWDVSNVKYMYYTFRNLGYKSNEFNIGNLDNWDVSSVTDMGYMFYNVGYSAITFDIGNLDNWDVSNVLNMSYMFNGAGKSATNFNIGDLSTWDVSNVISMRTMFQYAGYSATAFDIGNLDNWDVSNVVDTSYMFTAAGTNATTWNIGDLSNWDVSKVTDMKSMFAHAGYSAETFDVGNLGNWNVSNVTNMRTMFQCIGYSSTMFNIGNLSNWDVSRVTDMESMFNYTGFSADEFNIGDLSNWDVSNVTNMILMFNRYWSETEEYSLTSSYNIGDISRWNVSKVTNMKYMFGGFGYNDSDYSLNLSSWSVPLVTTYTDFNKDVESKVIAPTWVNENVDTEG